MPEGPEVHTIADKLHERLAGKTIVSITREQHCRYPSLQNIPGWPLEFPQNIVKIYAKGKKIIFILSTSSESSPDSTKHLISFLGMTGKWLFQKGTHSSLILNLGVVKGNLNVITQRIYFDDSRHMGFLNIASDILQFDTIMKVVGPDLLTDDITIVQFKSKIQNSRIKSKEIKEFLMEQKYFSGLGNYLVAEILYHSRIRPDRHLQELSEEDIQILLEWSKYLISKSYSQGGLTINDYWDPDGIKGSFETVIYNKHQDPYGNPVVKNTFKDGRTTHWVPNIQK